MASASSCSAVPRSASSANPEAAKTTLGRMIAGSGNANRRADRARRHRQRRFRAPLEPAGTVLRSNASGSNRQGRDGRVQMVFRQSYESLNPRQHVLDILSRPLRKQLNLPKAEIVPTVPLRLLDEVGLDADYLYRFANQMSDAQCQRVAIARALSISPPILVLDEPTTGMDLPIQGRILNLLRAASGEPEARPICSSPTIFRSLS